MSATARPRRATRRPAPTVLALALTLIVAGCGSNDSAASPKEGATSGTATAAASADAFPAEVKGTFGTVTIEKAPQRIVALTPQIADILVAMGVQPVAVATSSKDIAAATPWLEGKLSGELDPELVSGSEVNIEKVASYRPDLVLGSGYLFTAGTYRQMSHIAPTYAGLTKGNDDWDRTARAVGTLTGRDGRSVIRAADRRCATARSKVPDMSGKIYQYVAFEQSQFRYGNGAWLECFGLKPASQQVNSQLEAVTVSLENVRKLDADVLAIFDRNTQRDRLTSDPRFGRLPAARANAVIWADLRLAMATNSPGPLSMKYVVAHVLPTLQKSSLNHR